MDDGDEDAAGVGNLSDHILELQKQVDVEVTGVNVHQHAVEDKIHHNDPKHAHGSGNGDDEEGEDEKPILARTPAERALKYYERAKNLYTRGGGTSIELEVVLRDVSIAGNFARGEIKMIYFLAKVFLQQLDYSASIYALRNVLRIDDRNRAAIVMIGELLLRRGQELFGEAAIMNQQVEMNRRQQAQVKANYEKAKQDAEDTIELLKMQQQQHMKAVEMSKKLGFDKKGGKKDQSTISGGASLAALSAKLNNVEIPNPPVYIRVPGRVLAFVKNQFRLASTMFSQGLEFDRDNYRAHMFRSVCLVQAQEYEQAIESVTRAHHLCTMELKELQPAQKSFNTSAEEIRASRQGKRPDTVKDEDMDTEAGVQKVQMREQERQKSLFWSEHSVYETEEIEITVKLMTRRAAEMLIMRGKLYGAIGLTEKGNQDLRRAVQIWSDHPEAVKFGLRSFVRADTIYNICIKKFRKGGDDNIKECEKLIAMAVSLSPEDIKLYILQCQIMRSMKELEKAYAAIQRASNIYQGHSDFDMRIPEEIVKETNLVYNDIALQCAGKGEYEKALLLLNKVIVAEQALGKGVADIDYRFLVNRGDCYRAQLKFAQALVDYNDALDIMQRAKLGASSGIEGARREWVVRTRLSITYYAVGCNYFNESAFGDAEQVLTKALENNPKVAEYYLTRGKARYYNGSYQAAYSDIKQTLVLNPDCEEAKVRLRQFAAMGGSFTDDASSTKDNNDIGMTLAQATNSSKIIEAVQPNTDDMVQMMLNPRGAKKLPDIHKVNSGERSQSAGLFSERRNTDVTTINSKLGLSSLIKTSYVIHNTKVQTIMHSKYDATKSCYWSMFDNAKKMGQARSKPPINRDKMNDNNSSTPGHDNDDDELESVESRGGTRRRVQKSYTTSGLKRYSTKQTKKALKTGGIIAGVLTHKNDPYLHAVDGPKDSKSVKKSMTIDVSARPRTNRFKQSVVKNDNDDGAVQSFKTTNRFEDLVNDTSDWRKDIRAGDTDADLLAALMGGDGSSTYFDTYNDEINDEPNLKSKKKRGKKKKSKKVQETTGTAIASEVNDDDLEFDESDWLEGESELQARERQLNAAEEFLKTTRQASSGIADMFEAHGLKSNLNMNLFGGSALVEDEDKEESALIALTEEEELQLAYEERVKAEHEEMRRKRKEKREEIMKKNNLSFLDDPKEDD